MITVYDLILINIWMYLYTYFYTLSFPKLVGPRTTNSQLATLDRQWCFLRWCWSQSLSGPYCWWKKSCATQGDWIKIIQKKYHAAKNGECTFPWPWVAFKQHQCHFYFGNSQRLCCLLTKNPPPHMSSQSSHHPMPWNDSRQQHRPDAASIDALLACRGALYNPAMIDYWYIVWLWTNIPKKTCIVIVTFVLFQNIFVT